MLSRLHHRFKSSDGKSYGNMFPEVAPLIYPELDQLQLDKSAGEKLSKMKKRKEFVGEYLDKRAQAKFASTENSTSWSIPSSQFSLTCHYQTAENPTSQLNQGPKPVFTSRYADPTHPASSGDPLAFVTGGRFTTDDIPRRQAHQSHFRSRCPSSIYDDYQMRENSRSNAPAPHGRPFGLTEAIGVIRDFRNTPNGYQAPRDGLYDHHGRNQASRGPLGERDDRQSNPLAKLLKKVGVYRKISAETRD